MHKILPSRPLQVIAFLLALGFLIQHFNDSLLSGPASDVARRSITAIESPKSNRDPAATNATNATRNSNSNSDQVSTKSFPSFQHGGFIVFLHIPKTGGTTIRKTFQKLPGVTYMFSNRRAKYETLVQEVHQNWLTKRNNADGNNNNNNNKISRIGILEIHARNNPTLLEICSQLHQWRETAAQNRVPFFAFTILRDPTSFAISYFNYYHGMQWEKRRFEYLPTEQMTEENFLRTMHLSPQCLFLTRSEQAYQRNHPELRVNLTQSECESAYKCLQGTMDWIGTTERLHNETIPLLKNLLVTSGVPTTGKNQTGTTSQQGQRTNVKVENAGPRIFGKHNISSTSWERLERMTRWDQDMYQKAIKEYKCQNKSQELF
ncbi:expressed unknown protein [Seminavis robusta]|uniref:Sulfotransferase n=1 Tax=Seminavis robusta TaxID=568900 RepID=A0A9N8EA32_9STRA|nr:expressed unknown protein [Seminavis robusta]|eukprot:Sro867_g213200.1 n/a (376) ;mRNA; f:35285-36412